MTDAPLYRQAAEYLRRRILTGELAPGAQLPTEMALCDSLGISRHTAREALRILTEDGLILRRRGAGTVVADAPAPAFAQTLGDFDDIMQYARDARFVCQSAESPDIEALDALGLTGEFTLLTGLRQARQEPPMALTRVFVRADIAPDMDTVNRLSGSISEWLETRHAVAITRVTQRMEAVALSAPEASILDVPAETPALRTIRRYRDTSGEIIQLSESLHPAGRFAYEMRLERGT